MGELDVDGLAEAVLEQVEHGLELARKARPQQPVEGHHQLAGVELRQDADHGQDLAVAEDREDAVHLRNAAPHPAHEVTERQRLEAAVAEVDQVDVALRVAVNLGGLLHRAQRGLLESHQHRVVGDRAVDGAGAEAEHQPGHAVGVADARRPTHFAARKGDTREDREEHAADLAPHDLLDENAHLLLEVDQAALAAVLDGVGMEDRGVDLGDGILERGQPLLERAAVGDEQALVLAGEGVADAVLEQARRAHHQWHLAHGVEHLAEPSMDGGREGAALEEPLHERVLVADLFGALVLDVDELVEVVVLDELEDAVRGQEVRSRHLVLAGEAAAALRSSEDGVGQDEPGRLAAEPPIAPVGRDHVVEHGRELAHPDEPLRDRDEVQLIGEQAADQCRPGADHVLARRHHFARREVQELVDLVPQRVERRVGVLGEARAFVRQHPLFDLQDGGRDLVRRHVALGVLEGEVVQRLARLAGELRLRAIGVVVRAGAAELEGHRQVVEGVEVHQPLALEVHQEPAADAVGELGTAPSQVLELLPPVNHHVAPFSVARRAGRRSRRLARDAGSPSAPIVAVIRRSRRIRPRAPAGGRRGRRRSSARPPHRRP